MISRSESNIKEPLDIVGSSTFGRYPKISISKTYNMLISDDWLVPYGGYVTLNDSFGNPIQFGNVGRAVYTSNILNRIILVSDATVYSVEVTFNPNAVNPYNVLYTVIGTLQTTTSSVSIAENNGGQILISDGLHLYIYNPNTSPTFSTSNITGGFTIDFTPGYVTFHDSYFICAATNDTGSVALDGPPNTWRLSASNNGLSWPVQAQNIGTLETKPDMIIAPVRVPGKGNMVFIFGQNVTEPWYDVGFQLFPYQRNSSFTIDYGVVNPATIATDDEMVVWLAQNEKSGPVIMFSNGDAGEKITTDGIDYLLSQLQAPDDSEAFMFRQDGHVIYHINFYTDNLSLFYDFNTKRFFHACDENFNYFIGKDLCFYNNQYYFVSKNDGYLYAFDTIYTNYNGNVIPRVRICKNYRRKSQENFVVNDLGFTMEMGVDNYETNYVNNIVPTAVGSDYTTATVSFVGGNGYNAAATANIVGGQITSYTITQGGENYTYPPGVIITGDGTGASATCTISNTGARVDFSASYDGGETFGSDQTYWLNPTGKRINMLRFWNGGLTNDFVPQFKFEGLGRFIATEGEINIRT